MFLARYSPFEEDHVKQSRGPGRDLPSTLKSVYDTILHYDDAGDDIDSIASKADVSPGFVYSVLKRHRSGKKRKPPSVLLRARPTDHKPK